MQKESNYHILLYKDVRDTIYVEYSLSDLNCVLGISLTDIKPKIVRRIAKYIFKNNKTVKTIKYSNSYFPYDKCIEKNHFRIELPNEIEEIEKRQTTKSRYNIRRNIRLFEELGHVKFTHIKATQDEAKRYMDFYFQNKYISHSTEYGLDYKTYVDVYFTTDIYALMLENRIVSVLMSCEQCPIVYLENLTYDADFGKYSPGIILYDHFIKEMIRKSKKQIFLLGGNYEYKKRYGSIEEIVYDGEILRPFASICLSTKRQMKIIMEKIVPQKAYRFMTKKLHKIFNVTET